VLTPAEELEEHKEIPVMEITAPQPGGGGGGALLTPVQVDQEETSGQGVIRIHLHFSYCSPSLIQE
jgi:hypothetical protein